MSVDRRAGGAFAILVAAAIALSALPWLSAPFEWFETFAHELSHGAVAVLTGGSIDRIVLHVDGSGVIYYRGSLSPSLVTFLGYPGAVFCGLVIYRACGASPRMARKIALGLAVIVLITAVLWMRDIESWAVACALGAGFWGLWRLSAPQSGRGRASSEKLRAGLRLFMRLTGVYLMVSGVQSAWALLSFSGTSDASILASRLWLPAPFWTIAWLVVGAAALWWTWRGEVERRR